MATAMEIFRLLPRSNCRECGEKSCLAFAGAVAIGQKQLQACPYLTGEVGSGESEAGNQARLDAFTDSLPVIYSEIEKLDYHDVARRTGAKLNGENLQFSIMGKRFEILGNGSFATDLHIIPWLVIPFVDYVQRCKGNTPGNEWISFREVQGERERYPLFQSRIENVLCALADQNPEFFSDLIRLFSAREVPAQFASDISVLLYPFPLVPMMISYWKPEDGMESSLNLFFDRSVDVNLGGDSAFSLGAGFAQMLTKMAQVHGL